MEVLVGGTGSGNSKNHFHSGLSHSPVGLGFVSLSSLSEREGAPLELDSEEGPGASAAKESLKKNDDEE